MTIISFNSSNGFTAEFQGSGRKALVYLIGDDKQVATFASAMGFSEIKKSVWGSTWERGLNSAHVDGQRRELFGRFLVASAKCGLVRGKQIQYAKDI